MNRIYLILLLLSMTACHTSKHNTYNSDEYVDSTAKYSSNSETFNWTSALKNLVISFDTLEIFVEPMTPPVCQSDTSVISSSDKSLTHRIHIKAANARIDENYMIESDTYNHTQSKDSASVLRNTIQSTEEISDTTVISKPPDWIILGVIILCFIIVFRWLR